MSAATKIPPQSAAGTRSERRQQLTLWALDSHAAYSSPVVGVSTAGASAGAAGAATPLPLRLNPYAWARGCETLTREDEARLAKRMRAGDAVAKERLFEAGARWALTIARWYVTERAPLDDLAQIAWMTLWRTLPQFDADEVRLTTFVGMAILRDVRRAVDEMSSPIHRPVHIVDAERREWRFVERYEAEHGVEPSEDLLATAMDAPAKVVRSQRLAAKHRPLVVSLDAPIAIQGRRSAYEMNLSEMLPSEDERGDPVEMAARTERSAVVSAFAAKCLTERQRAVLALFYGDDRELSGNLAAIARRLTMTRERARQLHDGALTRLRKANVKSGGALSRLYAEMD